MTKSLEEKKREFEERWREPIERERASTFLMMRVIGESEGLTKKELWRRLVEISRQEGVDSDVVLLVGINGQLERYLSNRIALGYLDVEAGHVPLLEYRKFKLSERGRQFLEQHKEEADRLIQKYVYHREE
jgi:hypothetical protein